MWKKFKTYKNYMNFMSTAMLFLVILLALLNMYWEWNKSEKETYNSVEINLPILDWQRYTNLSKQYSPPEAP